jgi:epsilon-lactone hydrolase
MAGFGHYKVLSVDYRRPPAAFYQATLGDVVKAWKCAVAMNDPENTGMNGLSSGGALVSSARTSA